VIKGKWFIWFIWQGEKYPNGIIWNRTNEENDKIAEIKNVRLHGFYNAGSLKKMILKIYQTKIYYRNLLST
jgi:hypothetical protein